MRVLRLTAGRLTGMVFVLLVISLCTYALFALLPEDPARMSCSKPCTPESLALARGFMGFDKPWIQQYLDFVGGIFAGRSFGSGPTMITCDAPCFGYSFLQNAPVTDLITSRMPVTVSLALGAAVIWLVGGVALGVFSALRRGTAADRLTMAFTLAGVSAPTFLLGLLGILIFGFTFNMVPVSGYVALADDPVGWAWHLITPWLVLAAVHIAIYARLTRTQMLEVLGEDHIRTARAIGLAERTVIGKHALRGVALPVVTMFAIDLGGLLGGAVITERLFALPGLGGLLIDAVSLKDLPLLLGITVFAAALVIVANFVADVCYGLLDPRARVN